jgi:hypothetical protein
LIDWLRCHPIREEHGLHRRGKVYSVVQIIFYNIYGWNCRMKAACRNFARSLDQHLIWGEEEEERDAIVEMQPENACIQPGMQLWQGIAST